MRKQRLNLETSRGQQFIVAGLVGLVEEEGLTPHEAFEVLEEIKRATFPALADIHREKKAGGA